MKDHDKVRGMQVFCYACATLAVFALLFLFLIWNSTHSAEDIDALTISITALEVFLIVSAFSGFWMLRSVVVSKAEEAAEVCTKKYVEQYMKEYMTNDGGVIVRRTVMEGLENQPKENFSNSEEVDEQVAALGKEPNYD